MIAERGMATGPLLLGCVALFATRRALVLGAASADGHGITREEQPIFYWTCVVASLAAATLLLFAGLYR